MKTLHLTPELRGHAQRLVTPCFLLDPEVVAGSYRALTTSLPRAGIYYAVKANPLPAVLDRLAAEGSGFEVASRGELEAALATGVPGAAMLSSNPVKHPEFIAAAAAHGVDRFAFDSETELEKLAALAPGSRVYCRVQVDNSGSDWPLSRKFGVPAEGVVRLLLQAAERGLRPYGATFHVGSQCRSTASWRAAILTCAEIYREAARRGLPLEMLNLGGGFPVQHLAPIPDLDGLGHLIEALVAEHFPSDLEVVVEPGRALVGSSAILVTSVIGRADRGTERWLYLDAGVFNGLMETIAGFGYELETDRKGPTRSYAVAGPTCDSVDVMFNAVELPELDVGDRLYVLNAGAYTLSYVSHFNGFEPPAVHLVHGAGRDAEAEAVAALLS